MSCYNPINIYNRSLFYRSGIDKVNFYVPCGKCFACQKQNIKDWTIRAYYHWKYYTEVLGGRVMFVTLTYNDDYLPYYTINVDGVNIKVTCFSKKHIDRFLNSLRKHFEEKFGVTGIDYFITSEYGEKLFRSHYHGLLFFPKIKCSNAYLRSVVERYWKYGFIKFSLEKDGGAFVTSPKAIKYTAKYVNKDCAFYDIPAVKELNELIKAARFELHFNPDSQEYKYIVNKGLSVMPKHWQSIGFGAYMKDCLLAQQENDLIHSFKYGVRIKTEQYFYRIPNYIRGLLFFQYKKYSNVPSYDKVLKALVIKDRVIRGLSRQGRDLRLKLFNSQVENLAFNYEKDTSVIALKSLFKNDISNLNNFFIDYVTEYNQYWLSFEHFSNHIRSLAPDLTDLAKYSLCVKGVNNKNNYFADWLYSLQNQVKEFPDELPIFSPLFDKKYRETEMFHNSILRYDIFIDMVTAMVNYRNKINTTARHEKDRKLQIFKNKYFYA